MKKSAVLFFSITALVGISSLAYASSAQQQKSAAPIDVTSVATAVSSAPNHVIELRDEDILSVASPVNLAVQGLTVHAAAVTAAGAMRSTLALKVRKGRDRAFSSTT